MRKINNFTTRSFLLGFLTIFSLIIIVNPLSNQNFTVTPVRAWTDTYSDTVWEDPPGNVPNNDFMNRSYYLGDITTNNSHPLNVSRMSPDWYNVTVPRGFYLRVDINFNSSFLYDTSGSPIDPLNSTSGYYANLDLYLYAENGTMIDSSDGNGELESVGPYKALTNESLYIKVNISLDASWVGANYNYSTLYNMSVVIDDIYEAINSNDNIDDLNPSDDEIFTGYYSHLRLVENSSQDYYIIYLENRSYLDIFCNQSFSAYGVTLSLLSPNSTSDQEVVWATSVAGYLNCTLFTYINTTDFYYLKASTPMGETIHYSLNISIIDTYDHDGSNNIRANADIIADGDYMGLTVDSGDPDFYEIYVKESQRIMVTVTYLPLVEDMEVGLYESASSTETVADPVKIGNSYRIGPYFSVNDQLFLLSVNSSNENPAYYHLKIEVFGPDDIYEENDYLVDAVLMPSESHEYKPTVDEPFGGLIALKNDPDYYAFALLPGDKITVQIFFNTSAADLNLYLYNSSFKLVEESSSSSKDYEIVTATAYVSGIFVVKVSGSFSSFVEVVVPYNMTIDIIKADDEFEANDEPDGAAAIAEGHYRNLISRLGNDDWYYLYLHEGDQINISLTFFPEYQEDNWNDLDLDLLYDDGTLAQRSHTMSNESIYFVADESGKYLIDVVLISGYSNSYNLTISITETDDPWEDNDVFGQAKKLTFTGDPLNDSVTNDYSGLIMRVEDDDYYKVTVPSGLAVIVTLTFPNDADLDLKLYNASGVLLGSSSNPIGVMESVGPIVYNISMKGDLYICVTMDSGLLTTYTLEITIGPEKILVTTSSVPPFTQKTWPKTTLTKDLFGSLIGPATITIVIGGAGGASAYGLYKTGALSKMKNNFGKKFGKGGKKGSGGSGGSSKGGKG